MLLRVLTTNADDLFSFCRLGLIIGVWVCSVMTNVVKGAVNTLIVCWADSPAIFESQHPALTTEMAESWSAVFFDETVQIRPVYGALLQRAVVA